MVKAFGAAVVVGVAIVGVAFAGPQGSTYKLTANLKARSEVPKTVGVPASAVGLFTATAVLQRYGGAKITWRLSFSHLTGRASGGAHIHRGKPGKAGGVMVALCGACKSGQKGTVTVTTAQWKAIKAGGAYVNVHTAKNAAGEVRGQVKASEAGSSSDPAPTPTPAPTPEPPPYP